MSKVREFLEKYYSAVKIHPLTKENDYWDEIRPVIVEFVETFSLELNLEIIEMLFETVYFLGVLSARQRRKE